MQPHVHVSLKGKNSGGGVWRRGGGARSLWLWKWRIQRLQRVYGGARTTVMFGKGEHINGSGYHLVLCMLQSESVLSVAQDLAQAQGACEVAITTRCCKQVVRALLPRRALVCTSHTEPRYARKWANEEAGLGGARSCDAHANGRTDHRVCSSCKRACQNSHPSILTFTPSIPCTLVLCLLSVNSFLLIHTPSLSF